MNEHVHPRFAAILNELVQSANTAQSKVAGEATTDTITLHPEAQTKLDFAGVMVASVLNGLVDMGKAQNGIVLDTQGPDFTITARDLGLAILKMTAALEAMKNLREWIVEYNAAISAASDDERNATPKAS